MLFYVTFIFIPISGTCPKGWIYAPISNKCLIISPTFPIVDGARIDCKNAGGDLAQFASLKELKEAVLLLKPISKCMKSFYEDMAY